MHPRIAVHTIDRVDRGQRSAFPLCLRDTARALTCTQPGACTRHGRNHRLYRRRRARRSPLGQGPSARLRTARRRRMCYGHGRQRFAGAARGAVLRRAGRLVLELRARSVRRTSRTDRQGTPPLRRRRVWDGANFAARAGATAPDRRFDEFLAPERLARAARTSTSLYASSSPDTRSPTSRRRWSGTNIAPERRPTSPDVRLRKVTVGISVQVHVLARDSAGRTAPAATGRASSWRSRCPLQSHGVTNRSRPSGPSRQRFVD